jgi:hypothetical protein
MSMRISKILILLVLNVILAGSLACGSAVAPALPTSDWVGPHGETEYEYISRQGYVEGADRQPIYLVNNPQAHNPSWEELRDFLQQDKTDENEFNESSYNVAEFAEDLHNNAEEFEIRAAFVSIDFENSLPLYINAFNTTDRGIVFIDDRNFIGYFPCSRDTVVDVKLDEEYICELIFPCIEYTFESWGVVSAIYIQW